jgi:hypothetical protein
MHFMSLIGLRRFLSIIVLLYFVCSYNELLGSNRDNSTFIKEVNFRANASGQAVLTNEFLQKISEASGKMRVYTSYKINSTIVTTISKANTNSNRVIISLQRPLISGDSYYKDFSLQDNLVPDIFSGIISIDNGNGKRIYHAVFRKENVDSYPLIILDTIFSNNNSNANLNVRLTNLDPSYSEKKYLDFIRYANALEEYYNAMKFLNYVEEEIIALGELKLESVILDEFKLCDIESVMGEIAYQDFFNFQIIKRNDIAGVIDKYGYLKESVLQLRNNFNSTISAIDMLFLIEGLTYLEKSNHSKAKNNFQKALNYNRFNVPAIIEIGKLDLLENDTKKALAEAKYILKEIAPSGDWMQLALDFTSVVYDSICGKTVSFINENKYLEALAEVKILESFCEDSFPYKCDERIIQMNKDIRFGMYNSYISVAQRALDTDNLSFSEMYAKSAMEYQNEYAEIIGEYKLAEEMLRKMFIKYMVSASDKKKEGDFERAIYYYDNAKRFCNSYSFLICPGTLDSDIANLQQQKERQDKLALAKPKIISIAALANLPEVKSEHRSRILETLSHGHLMAWAGEIIEAKISLEDAINESEIFALYNDTLVFSRIQNLKQRIHQKECELNNDIIINRLHKIQLQIKFLEFASAMDSLEQLNRFVEKISDCNIELKDSILMLQSYAPAAEYQNMLRSAARLLNSDTQHKHEVFFQRYQRAQDIWEKNKLKLIGIEHLSLVDYISKSSMLDFVIKGVKYFSDTGKHDEAILLLSALKEKGISSKNSKEIQEYAGAKAAAYYKKILPKTNPANLAKKITNEDSWFKHFVKAFKKSW